MRRSNSSSILGIVYSTPARRVGLAALAVTLLLCAVSLMGGRRALPLGARALEAAPQGNGSQTGAPTIPPVHRAQFLPPRPVPSTYDGLTSTARLMASGAVRPLSLATEDFNEDGWPDLVAGYATASGDGVAVVYFGDRDAYAPETPQTLAGIAHGQFPMPFLAEARAFALPEAPDFLAAGDFNKGGNPGLLVGARGSEQLYLLAGDGRGKLGAPQSVPLPGKLTAMVAGQIGLGDSSRDVAVGVVGINGPKLLIYKGALGGLFAAPVVYSLPAEATSLKIGSLDDDPYGDVAILAGRSLFILHGQLWGTGAASGVPLSPAPELESVPLPSPATAFAIGDFIWERNNRMEIAVLSGSGVQILSRGTPDKRPVTVAQIRTARQAMAQLRLARLRAGTPPPVPPAWQPGQTQPWQVAQSINVAAAGSASDLEAITTALPNRAPQSVLLVGTSASQVHLLTEPLGVANASPTSDSAGPTIAMGTTSGAAQSAASWSDDTVATGGAPAAILPMRVHVSARPGLVTLNHGQVPPVVIRGLQGDPITVNRTDDTAAASACAGGSNDCSLRGAIIYADSHPGTTINIPAGTYTLTIGEDDDPGADPTKGDLDINASMTIVGAGAGSTIIQANFPVVDGQDGKIFGVNQDGSHDGLQVSISGVTLENARNSVGNLDPTVAYTGGAVDFFLTGTSVSYSLSNCVIQNSTNVHAYGAGLNVDSGVDSKGNFGGQNHGTVTISNCTIIGNTTQAINSTAGSGANCAGQCAGSFAPGGGINLFADVHNVTISNSIISGNQTSAGSPPTGAYEGGGLYIRHTNGGTVLIHASTIGDAVNGGNRSASRGGGISISGGANQNTTIDQGSIIQDNISGTLSAGTGEGGGIYVGTVGSTTLTQVTITGNSLSSNTTDQRGGGGIAVGDVTSPVTVSDCRIVGNSASAGGVGGGAGTGLHKDNQSGTVTATDNWWGCNAGPSASPCDTAVIGGGGSGSPSLSFNPWLLLSLTPSVAQNLENGGTITFTADLNHDSNGSPTLNNIPDGTPISFGTTGGIGSDNPTNTTVSSGIATSTFTASAIGSGTVTTTVDSQAGSTPVTVYVPVTIASSPSGESFSVTGAAGCATGTYTTPKTLNWSVASCAVQFASPVSDGAGAQLVFNNWSDGNTGNPRTISTPASPATLTANFAQQYQLTTAVSPVGDGTVTAPVSGTFLNSGAAVTLSATANAGYTFNNWGVTSGSATFGNAALASTTVTLSSGPATVTANFAELKTSLSGLITGKAGPQNARVWTITLTNTGPGAANAPQINSLTLKQTGGAACTPVTSSAFPMTLGNIAPASSGSGAVTIDFTGCPNNARFTATFSFSANAGAATGSRTLYNQFQ